MEKVLLHYEVQMSVLTEGVDNSNNIARLLFLPS